MSVGLSAENVLFACVLRRGFIRLIEMLFVCVSVGLSAENLKLAYVFREGLYA